MTDYNERMLEETQQLEKKEAERRKIEKMTDLQRHEYFSLKLAQLECLFHAGGEDKDDTD